MRIDCRICLVAFEYERAPGVAGRLPRYCSEACRREAGRQRQTARPRKPRVLLAPQRRSELAGLAAAVRWSTATPAERAEAGRAAARARYTAEQRAIAQARRDELALRRLAPCPYCGEPVGRASRTKCGKDECRLLYNAERMGVYNHERRARKKALPNERFRRSEVFDRDGWVCGICSEPVDRGLLYPDPMSVSLDHVVPLSLGGSHTRENCRCSHLICNVRRGNRAA